MTLKVYVALLRSFHPEGRELIRRALDTLVPVLPSRLLPEDVSKVVKWTKKILADDGYSMPQLCHIWHMIIRFSNVFYSYRSQLVPQMLNAISRIGLSNAATEYRLVAVAIADLVIKWEIQKPDKAKNWRTGRRVWAKEVRGMARHGFGFLQTVVETARANRAGRNGLVGAVKNDVRARGENERTGTKGHFSIDFGGKRALLAPEFGARQRFLPQWVHQSLSRFHRFDQKGKGHFD